jgi:hypothetical protein
MKFQMFQLQTSVHLVLQDNWFEGPVMYKELLNSPLTQQQQPSMNLFIIEVILSRQGFKLYREDKPSYGTFELKQQSSNMHPFKLICQKIKEILIKYDIGEQRPLKPPVFR